MSTTPSNLQFWNYFSKSEYIKFQTYLSNLQLVSLFCLTILQIIYFKVGESFLKHSVDLIITLHNYKMLFFKHAQQEYIYNKCHLLTECLLYLLYFQQDVFQIIHHVSGKLYGICEKFFFLK